MPLAKVWRGIARRPKKLAVSGKSRIEDRNVGISGDGGIKPALVGVEAAQNGAASRCAGAGRGVVVGELYAALPDVFEEVGHKAPEVVFGIVDADGEDGWPSQLVDEDEEDVGLGSWFGDVFRETKASGDTCACDGGGGFQEVSAFHCLFSNR
jgi:hypothetical protein